MGPCCTVTFPQGNGAPVHCRAPFACDAQVACTGRDNLVRIPKWNRDNCAVHSTSSDATIGQPSHPQPSCLFTTAIAPLAIIVPRLRYVAQVLLIPQVHQRRLSRLEQFFPLLPLLHVYIAVLGPATVYLHPLPTWGDHRRHVGGRRRCQAGV